MGGSFIYLWGTAQGRRRSKGKSKPEMGLQSLGQGSWIRAQNREGSGRVETQSSENGN